MYIIVGLGNPGSRYQRTRHNAGFLALDFFAQKNNLEFKAGKGDFYFSLAKAETQEFLLVKPSSYVNNSGFAVKEVLDFYNENIENVLVVYDDINLPFGSFKVRASGGSGGHNGMSSIIDVNGSNNFPRIKLGIGSDFENGKMADYVLSKFLNSEFSELEKILENINLLIENFAFGGTKQLLDANSKLL